MVRVLLIDDDVWVRSAIRAMLEDAGYAVVEADGKHALRAFKAQPYNAILCDLFMPDKDGLENLVEFAFDLDPKAASNLALPAWQLDDDDYVLSFTRPASARPGTAGSSPAASRRGREARSPAG